MKNIYVLIFLTFLFTFKGSAQSTLVLQPDSATGKNACLINWTPDNSGNTNFYPPIYVNALAWTKNDSSYMTRSLLQFDLSSIAARSVITSATLILYSDSIDGQWSQHISGSNAAWLQRVTSPWQSTTVTWNTQPTTTTLNEASLPQDTNPYENYIVNVTPLVQDMIDSSSSSFGFMLLLQTEVLYRSLVFASCYNHNSGLHPKLVINYSPPLPVASFQASSSSICVNNCIDFNNHSVNGTSWLWFFPGATTHLSTDENPQNICYSTAGVYDVLLIASNAAGGDTLYRTSYITVNPSPALPIINRSHDTLFCSTNAEYTSYQWYYFNAAIPGATDTFLLAAYSGNYSVKVNNANGCSVTDSMDVILGIKEFEPDSSYILFPNPVNNELKMYIKKAFNHAELEVTDILGRKILQQISDAAKGNQLIIDFNGVAQGAYLVTITLDGQITTRKVIKE